MRLIGTTRQTIGRIRDGTHRDQDIIDPKDPVKLGLCSKKEFDAEIARAEATARAREANLAKARAPARRPRGRGRGGLTPLSPQGRERGRGAG